jgi:transcriptional regulator with XRE-family HTH domain
VRVAGSVAAETAQTAEAGAADAANLSGRLGSLLWQWRERRSLSLGQLARAAGVHKSALSRWEAGTFKPRVAELEATLAALGVSAAESALAFACIPAPRAVRHLSSDLAAATSAPLTKGDLLRALRLRKGWTQAELAHEVGVSHQLVAYWERMERLPSHEQIHALCFALGARLDEVVALTTGSSADPPGREARTWDEAEQEIRAFIVSGLTVSPDVLPYYLLDERLWRWSLREERARHWLLRVRVYHAFNHRAHLHWGLVDRMLRKAREVVPDAEMGLELRLRHLILSARLAVFGGHRPAPERGVRLLQPWVEASRSLPEFQAWILSDLAKYAALEGSFDGAVALSEQASAAAERRDHWLELWLRRCDQGALLVQAGRAEEALAVLPDPAAWVWHDVRRVAPNPGDGAVRDDEGYVQACLSRAEAHAALGDLTAASEALSSARELLAAIGIPEEKQRAAALAARLPSGLQSP